MKVLIVASDKSELKAFPDKFIKIASGVGPVLSSAFTAFAIAEHHPDIVFSVGSAGSAGKLRIGDCISFSRVITPDSDISAYGLEKGYTLTSDRKKLGAIPLDGNSDYILSSSGTFAAKPGEGNLFFDAADMEAYGVALSSSLKGIPCYAVKIITDLIGNHVNLGTYGYTLRQLRILLPEKVEEVLSAL